MRTIMQRDVRNSLLSLNPNVCEAVRNSEGSSGDLVDSPRSSSQTNMCDSVDSITNTNYANCLRGISDSKFRWHDGWAEKDSIKPSTSDGHTVTGTENITAIYNSADHRRIRVPSQKAVPPRSRTELTLSTSYLRDESGTSNSVTDNSNVISSTYRGIPNVVSHVYDQEADITPIRGKKGVLQERTGCENSDDGLASNQSMSPEDCEQALRANYDEEEDNGDDNSGKQDADCERNYYTMRSTPALTVAQRMEKLRESTEAKMQQRHDEWRLKKKIPGRPKTLIQSKVSHLLALAHHVNRPESKGERALAITNTNVNNDEQ